VHILRRQFALRRTDFVILVLMLYWIDVLSNLNARILSVFVSSGFYDTSSFKMWVLSVGTHKILEYKKCNTVKTDVQTRIIFLPSSSMTSWFNLQILNIKANNTRSVHLNVNVHYFMLVTFLLTTPHNNNL